MNRLKSHYGICLVFLIFSFHQQLFAQHSDCLTALPICDNANLNFSSSGPGIDDFANPNNDNGCLLFGEHQSVWLVIKISQLSNPNAELGFTLTPIGNDNNDFDFAVYGPQSSCENLGSPVACSYANNDPATCTFCPQTGMGMGEMDAIEGATGNGFVSMIEVQPSEIYFILIDNFEANQTGFTLEWTGDAILDCDLYCLANAGSNNISQTPNNQSINFPSANNPSQYILCDGDGMLFSTDENYTLPSSILGEESSLLWALYSEEPPAFPSPDDAAFTGILLDEEFITEINTNGIQSALPNGLNLTDNTLWIVPVTGDDGAGNGNPNGNIAIDGDGDDCYHYGEPFAITYLNEIEYAAAYGCDQFEVTISGGMPELFGGGYVISDVQPADAVLDNYFPQFGETVTCTGIDLGEAWSFTLTDGNGCSIQASGIFNFTGDVPIIEVEAVQSFCEGDSVTLIATTDFVGTDYEWEWTDGSGQIWQEQNIFLENPVEGDYTVSLVVDGCSGGSEQVQLQIYENPILDALADQNSCESEFDFNTINYTGQNIDNPTFNFYSDANGMPNLPVQPVISNGGTYWVEVVNDNNCTDQEPIQIALNDLNVSLSDVQNISCFGETDGAVNTNVFGGNPPLTFEWTGSNATTEDLSGLGAGTYELLVTDTLGCQDSLTAMVTEPNEFELALAGFTDPSCGGADDGTATVVVSGGTSPFAYNWSNGGFNSPTATDLDPDENYSVTVTDANNCTGSLNNFFDLTEPDEIQLAANTQNTQCGANEGMISVIVSGGSGNFIYEWAHNGNLNSNTASNLISGIYTVTVTDDSGCSLTENFTISDIGSPTVSIENVKPENCYQHNGSIEISVVGDPSNFTFEWSHNTNLEGLTAQLLDANDYFVTVSNSSGCQAILEINVPLAEGAEIGVTDIQLASCGEATNGQATLEVTGGTLPYMYVWSHDQNLNAPTATNLPVGNITVGIVDGNNCFTIFSFAMEAFDNQELVVENTSPASCAQLDGSIEVTYINGVEPVSYLWSHNGNLDAPLAQNITGGVYTVLATDANGCKDLLEVNLPNLDGPEIVYNVTPNTSCTAGDGILEAVVSGGLLPYSYEWSHNSNLDSPTADNLPEGSYTVTVSDANGCENELSGSVAFLNLNPPILDTISVKHTLCTICVGHIHMSTSGGVSPYTYEWEHVGGGGGGGFDENSIDSFQVDLCLGLYSITVTDANGCKDTATVKVEDSGELWYGVSFVNKQDEHCGQGDGTLTAVMEGGLPVNWVGHPEWYGQETITGLSAGIYKAYVIGSCVIPKEDTIFNIPPPVLELEDLQNISCAQNSLVSVGGSGGDGELSYIWSHDPALDTNIVENLAAGDYSVTLTDEFGCRDSLDFTITESQAPIVQIGDITHPNCEKPTGSVSIIAFGGVGELSFQWSHNPFLTGSEADFLQSGFYSVIVSDEEGCEIVLDFEIFENDLPELTILNQNDANCGESNGSIEVEVIGGNQPFQYQWSHNLNLNTTAATALESGVYGVTVSDFNGCRDSLQISINDTDAPEITINEIQNDLCNEGTGSIDISVIGGSGMLNTLWEHDPNLNSNFVENLTSGFYSVTVVDDLGCKAVEAIEIEGGLVPEIELLQFENANCNAQNGFLLVEVLSGTSPFIYEWQHDLTNNSPYISDLSGGTYHLNITDANGCTAENSFDIADTDPLVLEIQNLQPHLCDDQLGDVQIIAASGTPPFDYIWSHDSLLNSNVVTDLEGGMDKTYTVYATDQFNCFDSLNVNIPRLESPKIYIDSLLGAHCNADDGAAYLNTSPYAVYRINCGYEGNTVFYDRYGNPYLPDAYFEGGNTFDDIYVSNTPTNALFNPRRRGINNFNYRFPVENGTYTVRLGFATKQFVSNKIFDVFAEKELQLDDFVIFTEFGVSVAGHKEFEVTVTDATLDLDFISEQGNIEVSTIEIIPNVQPAYDWSWQQFPNNTDSQAINLGSGTYIVSITDEDGCTNSLDFDIDITEVEPEFVTEITVDSCGNQSGGINLTPVQPAVIRLNCGGSAYTTTDGRYFEANLGNSGQIQTTTADFTNTDDDVLYQSRRQDNADYYFEIPNGKYLVRLHFGEMSNNIPNSNKVFNIDLEKRKALPNFHVANAAGGNFLAVVREFEVYVNDGELNIDTKVATQDGELSALEILPLPDYPIDYNYGWSVGNQTSSFLEGLSEGQYDVTVTDTYGCENVFEYNVIEPPLPTIGILEIQDAVCDLPNGMITLANGNIAENGDFENGNTGFTSQYTPNVSSATAYVVGDNPAAWNGNFVACGDHTTGDGLMMIVNGATQPDLEVYCQTFSLPIGTTLDLSVWVTDVVSSNPPDLQFYVNGEAIGDILNVTSAACDWQELSSTWVNETEEVEICIVNHILASGGNDFALDDFSVIINNSNFTWTHDPTIMGDTAQNLSPGIYEIIATSQWGCQVSTTAEVGNSEPRGMEVGSLKIPHCDLFNGRSKITGENVYRINVGGNSYISPTTGYLFESDTYSTGGGTNFNNNEIEDTDETDLYQSHRLGNFEYQFPVPDSRDYEIILHFAEPSQNDRIFDVFVNSELIINDFNIYDEANLNTALTKSIIAEAPDSMLRIEFLGNGSNALLSAIEIFHAIPENSIFQWSHNSNLNAPQAENLGEGSYQVTITEPDGCIHEVDFVLGRPDDPELWLIGSVEPAACLGVLGSAEVDAVGIGGYTYEWSHNSTLDADAAFDLVTGDYTVTVTDKKNCKDTLDITLLDLTIPQIHLDSLGNTICQQDDGFIYVTATGGAGSFQYSWMHDDTLIVPFTMNLESGTYTVFVTDKNGCVAQRDIDITDLGPELELSQLTDTQCGESLGQIEVEEVGTPFGNWTLSWSHDSNLNGTTATNLPSGEYVIIAEDENTCTDTLTAFIGDTDGPQILDFVVGQPDSCEVATGFASLIINDNGSVLNYNWSHDALLNDSTVQNLPTGEYSVTVTDENDCVNEANFEISAPQSPTLTLGMLEIETCESANGQAQIFVTGGNAPLNFEWSHDNSLDTNFVNNLSEGTYSVTVMDSKLCSGNIDFNIKGIPSPLILAGSIQTTFCELANGEIHLEIESDADSIFYTWSHDANLNEPLATNLAEGSYSVTVSDNYDCETMANFEIEAVLDTLNTSQFESICDCESIEYLGVSYQTDTSFCVPFNALLTGCDSIHCFNLDILPNHIVQTSETTCDPTQVGIFDELLVNQFGCDSLVTTTVTILPRDTTYLDDETCDPNQVGVFDEILVNQFGCDSLITTTVTLTPSDTTYLEDETCEPSEAGIFDEILTNQFGCDSLVINTVDLLPSDSFYFPTYNCKEETWGVFPEFYTNEHGCDSLIVREYLPATYELEAVIEENQTVELGQTIQLEVFTNFFPDSILWSPPQGLDCTDCLEPTVFITENMSYILSLQDENGCTVTEEITINVKAIYDVYIPNAFSPNGDGINDIFHIYSSPNVQIVREFKIFDRWGNHVFEDYDFYPNDATHGWDGVFRGEKMNPAVFVWFAIVEFLDGEVRLFKGGVHLVR